MFSIDYQSRLPIYEQIINQVEKFIVAGVLSENEKLPSVRQLASDLGINPNTIQKAYTELENKKLIYSITGKGNFITPNIDTILESRKNTLISEIRCNMKELVNMGIDKQIIIEELCEIDTL